MLRTILKVVNRSLQQFALSTWITAISIALAGGLLMSIFLIQTQALAAFTGGAIGFDAVLGARGSQLQLVLNTVFHLETSPGNIPWSMYKQIKKDARVKLAIPYAVGDNYRGFRIVGTNEEIFTKFEYQKGKKLLVNKGGRFFNVQKREAVIGSFVAKETGLRVGSKINPYHGFIFDESQKHAEEYVVTGVLKTTNTPTDRIILIPIEGIFRMSGHVLRGGGEEYKAEANKAIDDKHKEVSAVMIKLNSPLAGFQLQRLINRQGKVASFAWPINKVVADFFSKMAWITKVLELIAYLVAIVAMASIIASLYNTMNERKREFAILRTLGARKHIIFSIIIMQSTMIAFIGSILSFVVAFAIMSLAKYITYAQTGVVLEVFQQNMALVWVPLGMVVLGAIAGLIPAIKAYKTDIAKNLLPSS
ncbi:ABC transporter permease [Candidatus Uabimicrobium amorphum]|uniref:Permease n=1 Tax=Uabimicrobium amorphum TaxID=2596890 RepID=A0A5S9IMA0_UABAM|nr:FtsX-like permease family protein [Candidatus Uabimicrobium amorphum]BBM84141.1 permease [Candidatus Uabimicrobium amorphum]